jgi:hypothetical protein
MYLLHRRPLLPTACVTLCRGHGRLPVIPAAEPRLWSRAAARVIHPSNRHYATGPFTEYLPLQHVHLAT